MDATQTELATERQELPPLCSSDFLGVTVKYKTIVADPPWDIKFGSTRTPCGDKDGWDANMKIKDLEYPTMSIEEICAMKVPADDDAHLYIWTINKYIEQTYAVARAWGFVPSTMLYWLKQPIGLGLGGGFRAVRRADSVLSPWQAGSQTPDRPQLVVVASRTALAKTRRLSNGRGVGKSRPILGNVRPPKASRLAFMGQRSIE